MTDEPEFHFKVTTDEIMAVMERELVDNVFIPAFAQFMRKKQTTALLKGSRLPRSRRPGAPRRHSHHRTRRSTQAPA